MTNKLTAKGLMLIRGERCLFRDLGFALDAGSALVLEGRNGTGKTSLLKALAGLIDLEEGEVRWNEVSLNRDRQTFLEGLVWMGHRPGFKADLTIAENLAFDQSLRAKSSVSLDEVLQQVQLQHQKHQLFRSLSAGQQRRTALARMLLAEAPLWLMDEPFTNLDREGRQLVLDIVDMHLGKGGLCILAAHQDVNLQAPLQRVALS